MFLGVLYGILGCSLWGFIYIIPLLLPEYSPATVAMARFTVYSIGSLVICYYCRKTLALLTASDWVKAFCLGFFGNAVYYVLLTKGVRLAGVPTSGMLMALIPLNVALLTNRPGAETTVVVPWRRLSLPLAMILVGLWIGNIDEFSEISVATSSAEYWLGFLCSFGAMALWTWFPIRNSQWLLKHPNVSPLAWTTAQGASMLPATLLCYVAVNFETFLHGGAVLGPTPVKFVLLMVVAGDYSISFRFRPADAKKIYLHSTPGTIIIERVNRSYRNAAPTPCRPARVFVRGDGNVSIKEHTRCIRSLKRSR